MVRSARAAATRLLHLVTLQRRDAETDAGASAGRDEQALLPQALLPQALSPQGLQRPRHRRAAHTQPRSASGRSAVCAGRQGTSSVAVQLRR
jgi:hypothetical protein